MSEILLFCAEPSGLKLGPGATPGEYISFVDSFARFDSEQYPDWLAWVNHPSTPPIEILPADSDLVAPGTDGSVQCPVCDRTLKSEFGLRSHLRSHAPKG